MGYHINIHPQYKMDSLMNDELVLNPSDDDDDDDDDDVQTYPIS